jgi:hypothetical protein
MSRSTKAIEAYRQARAELSAEDHHELMMDDLECETTGHHWYDGRCGRCGMKEPLDEGMGGLTAALLICAGWAFGMMSLALALHLAGVL